MENGKQNPAPSLVLKGHKLTVWSVAVFPDGKQAVSCSNDRTLKVWDLETATCTATLTGHQGAVFGTAILTDGKRIVSASRDTTLKVWDLDTGTCLITLTGHNDRVWGTAVSPDGKRIVSGSYDGTLKVWDPETGTCLATLEGHDASIGEWAVAILPDGNAVVSGSIDNTLKVWDPGTGQCRATLKGHTGWVRSVAVTPDGKTIVSGSRDCTLKMWDLETGRCRATWEGHTDAVNGIAVTPDGKRVLSGSLDNTLKMWDLETGSCLATFKGHGGPIYGTAITPDGRRALSASADRTLRVWDLSGFEAPAVLETLPVTRYTNAKVVLVGETGTGKTGLALRLAKNRWNVTESTHGQEVHSLPLPHPAKTDTAREVWLWDFAGQPDYRLIHQLYMDETALALMVMDPQKDDPFESLGHWEKALNKAVKRPFHKLLVAGRCDRGGMTVSRHKIEQYCKERGYNGYIDTAAKTGQGCIELKHLIHEHIPWDSLPYTATSQLFKSLKDAVIDIKNKGTVLIKISLLFQWMKDRLRRINFSEEELRTTVSLLAGQGLIRQLDFGDFLLLHPEYINNYASVVVRCARESTDEMGNVAKVNVLEGYLEYKGMKRLETGDEKILLRAMLQTFLDCSLCLEEETHEGTQLVFPSYFKRDRPEQPRHPAVLTSYRFSGPIDEIYATLVVRLYYAGDFEKDELWKNAADFKTLDGKQAGFMLTKSKDGEAELDVYFDKDVQENTKVSFIKYIHEHLLKRAETVTRERSYICPHCQTPVANPDVVHRMIDEGRKDILCIYCEQRFPLIDSIEQKFASPEFLEKVRAMDEKAERNLDNESRELVLVGEAMAITAEAGHIYRGYTNSDHGIDAEIEFKKGKGKNRKATGRKLYLQLKSGDSHLRKRKRDDKEIFKIKKKRWAEYWVAQAYPVMLVIRTSDKKIRWMNVTQYLKAHPDPKQIEFDGEPFTKENLCRYFPRTS